MNPKDIANRLSAMVPGQEPLTLKARVNTNGADSFTNTVIPRVRRRPLSKDDVLMVGAAIGETWHKFQVYNPAALPRIGDRVTDAQNVTYEVRKVDGRSAHGVYNILALQDK